MSTEETVSYADLISAAEQELHERASLSIQQRARISSRDRRIAELEGQNTALTAENAMLRSTWTPPADSAS